MSRKSQRQTMSCEACGKPMQIYPSEVGKRRYCSKACYGQTRLSEADTFWGRVDKSGGPKACWLWGGSKAGGQHGRYGHLMYRRTFVYAHRLAWELVKGTITDGLFVLHKCDNPLCCNPRHLFLGDHLANMADMRQKGRSSLGKPRPNAKTLRGAAHPGARFTEPEVADIRRRHSGGEISQQGLAREYGVSSMTISRIVNGHRYASTLT